MPDIFDEVEEDLRAERAQSFLRRYGVLLAAGVVAVLAGTAGYVWWAQQHQAAAEATADQFIGAAQLADKSKSSLAGVDRTVAGQAAATFAKLAAGSPAGYAVLARLRLAALQWELGERKEAIASWQGVADDGSAPQLLRDLATVTSAQHQVDTADPVTLKQTMEGLTGADNPWRPVAQQIIALLDLRQGKPQEAADMFKRIGADPAAPEGVRQMAADLMTTLPGAAAPAGAAGAAPPAPAASPAPGTPPPSASPAPAAGAAPPAAAPAPAPASASAPATRPAAPHKAAGTPKPAPHG